MKGVMGEWAMLGMSINRKTATHYCDYLKA